MGGNGALDVNGTFTISGGTLLAAGSSGMAVAPAAGSAQGWVGATYSVYAGESVSGGTLVGTFTAGTAPTAAGWVAAGWAAALPRPAAGPTADPARRADQNPAQRSRAAGCLYQRRTRLNDTKNGTGNCLMTSGNPGDPDTLLAAALQEASSSARLQSALMAGTNPDPRFVEILVDRCAVEPDFFVRDMLTWALTRHSSSETVPRLLHEVRAGGPQARSQALHTLSKIGDPRGWSAITPAVLRDPNDEVARSAWRTAVSLVPAGQEAELSRELCTQLGRGDREMQRSLSRAIAGLGEVALPMLAERVSHGDAGIRTHAIVTERLLHDPEADFEAAVAEAKRVAALTDAPTLGTQHIDR